MKTKALTWLHGLSALPLLIGCAAAPAAPAATADSVLAAQYRASGTHGALTGEEADRVMQAYEQRGPEGAQPQPGDNAGKAGDAGNAH
jgi:hypothetical protein